MAQIDRSQRRGDSVSYLRDFCRTLIGTGPARFDHTGLMPGVDSIVRGTAQA
jgi:hypothetical protein